MTRIAIGGCAYRSQVHVAHAQSVAGFAGICESAAVSLDIVYQHTSNLPQGRSTWLRGRIDSAGVSMAVSVDSDTAFNASELFKSFPIFTKADAIGIAPVVRKTARGPMLNIYSDLGQTYAASQCGGAHPDLWAGGFGVAVFNLQWFRDNWDKPFPEVFGEPEDSINQGEDIQMCRSVIKRGGRVIPLWVSTVHYDTSGYQIIGGQLTYRNGRMIIAGS